MRLLALIACMTSLVLVACSGDDSESATEWAQAFCSATGTWGDEIERVGDELPSLSALSTEALEQAATQTRTATDEYADELRALGTPDIEAKDEVESGLDELAEEIEAEADEIDDAVDDMVGLSNLVTAGREIAASLAAMFTALERTFEAFDAIDEATDDELEAAFREADACDRVGP